MNFDLDINNYKPEELREMFDLPPNYDKNIIEIKEANLKDNIVNNNEIDNETKINTINFITKAKNILINGNSAQNNNIIKDALIDIGNFNTQLMSSKLTENTEYMLQERPNTSFVNTQISDFYPGTINPIKKRTTIKNLNIDTRFRPNYYGSSSTDFNFTLPLTMNDVLSMQLTAIELPVTIFSISKQTGNNYFSIVVNDVPAVLLIPNGNYDLIGMNNILNTLLQDLGGVFANIIFAINLTQSGSGSGQMVVGPVSPLVTPTVITSISLNFQADINGNPDYNTPLPLKFGWIMGFRNGMYTNNLNYVSEGVVDLSPTRYAYLVVDDYNNNVNNSFYSAFNSSVLNKNILARIPMQTNNFSIYIANTLMESSNTREYFGPVNIQNLRIQLLDEYGRTIDLNNMDWSFNISMKTSYDI